MAEAGKDTRRPGASACPAKRCDLLLQQSGATAGRGRPVLPLSGLMLGLLLAPAGPRHTPGGSCSQFTNLQSGDEDPAALGRKDSQPRL